MKRILIAGPGRSGTSVLVAMVSKMGLSSSADSGRWFEGARAGFEAEYDSRTSPLVVKDPTLTWKLPAMLQTAEIAPEDIRLVLVPFRDLDVAATSRWEVAKRARNPSVAGALTGTLRPSRQAAKLARDLWLLLLALEAHDIPYRLVHYPRFMTDLDYFRRVANVAFPEIEDSAVVDAWRELRDDELIRDVVPESTGLVADLQSLSWFFARRVQRQVRRRRRIALGIWRRIRSLVEGST